MNTSTKKRKTYKQNYDYTLAPVHSIVIIWKTCYFYTFFSWHQNKSFYVSIHTYLLLFYSSLFVIFYRFTVAFRFVSVIYYIIRLATNRLRTAANYFFSLSGHTFLLRFILVFVLLYYNFSFSPLFLLFWLPTLLSYSIPSLFCTKVTFYCVRITATVNATLLSLILIRSLSSLQQIAIQTDNLSQSSYFLSNENNNRVSPLKHLHNFTFACTYKHNATFQIGKDIHAKG